MFIYSSCEKKTFGIFTRQKMYVLDMGPTCVFWTELFTKGLTRVECSIRVKTNPAREVGRKR